MIEVVTSITGNKDSIIETQNKGNALWTLFTDDLTRKSETWNLKPAYDRFKDNRRNSRIHKILIHKYSDADITIWQDGNKRLLITPEEAVEKYLQGCDMAIFKHQLRNCIYKEALEVAKLGLDNIETIIEQAKYYEDHEYGKEKGLCEGGFIIRKNNKRTQAFNEAWWADYCRFSRRDQLSLMPAIEKSGVIVNVIDEKWKILPDGSAMRESESVQIVNHLNNEGNWNEKK